MRKGLVGALVASAALVAVPALAQEYHYVKVAEIHLPTPNGHGDIVTYDPGNQMIYVSMKDDGLAVVDTRTQKVVLNFDASTRLLVKTLPAWIRLSVSRISCSVGL